VGLRTGLSTGIRISYEIKLISGADMMLTSSRQLVCAPPMAPT
jgi:hypothetical protein